MIFRPELARKIARGEKTQTRRPVKPGEKHCRYREGRDYAVQPGRGKPSSFRILILAVEGQALGDLTYRDARAEGFKTRDEFQAYWRSLYDGRWDPDERVWAIRFRLLTSHDKPRLLMPIGAGHHDPHANPGVDTPADHGYTADPRRAVRDEPEAVDQATQDRYARHAREAERITRRDVWLESRDRLQAEIDRLRQANLGAHTAKDIAALQSRVRSLDRKLAA